MFGLVQHPLNILAVYPSVFWLRGKRKSKNFAAIFLPDKWDFSVKRFMLLVLALDIQNAYLHLEFFLIRVKPVQFWTFSVFYLKSFWGAVCNSQTDSDLIFI